MKDQHFYSAHWLDNWSGATELEKLCKSHVYSCDESPKVFIDE